MKVSLVIPVFNERESVAVLHRAIDEALTPLGIEMEMIFVDDASDDDTLTKLKSIVAIDRRVSVVRLRKNSGQTAALSAGIERSRGEIVVTLDGDLQNDPRDIPRFLTEIERGCDLVAGWRSRRNDPIVSRKLPSMIANWFISRFLGVRVHDMGCGLKAYRGELIRRIPFYSDLHRFMPAICAFATSRIVEIEVRHHARRHGISKYGLSRTWRVLADVLAIKMLMSCAQRPLHWFGFWAAVVFVLTTLSGSYAWLVFWSSGWTSGYVLPGATVLLGYLSVSLLFAGIFAEIVVRSEPSNPIRVLSDQHVIRSSPSSTMPQRA